MRWNLPPLSATKSYPAKSSIGLRTLYPLRNKAPATLATPTAPIWRLDNLLIDTFCFFIETFYMKAIPILMAVLVAPVMAEDGQQAMADFVGGVYRNGGFAVVLDKDTAIVMGGLVNRDGDLYITPRGAYTNDRGTYSGQDGIVMQDGDLFSSKDGSVIGD